MLAKAEQLKPRLVEIRRAIHRHQNPVLRSTRQLGWWPEPWQNAALAARPASEKPASSAGWEAVTAR